MTDFVDTQGAPGITLDATTGSDITSNSISSNCVDLIVDLNGLFEPSGGARFTPLAPTRILDTRLKEYDQIFGHDALTLPVGGKAVPADATAVAENITVTDPTGIG